MESFGFCSNQIFRTKTLLIFCQGKILVHATPLFYMEKYSTHAIVMKYLNCMFCLTLVLLNPNAVDQDQLTSDETI